MKKRSEGHAAFILRGEPLRLIDDATFERVQAQIASNSAERPRDETELRSFTTHLFCGECGNVSCERRQSFWARKYAATTRRRGKIG